MAPHLVALSSAGSKTMQRLTADPCEKVTGDLLLDLAQGGHDAPFRQHLMSAEEETQVVAMYLAGATAMEVAAQFGAHRLTVSRAVRRAGSRVGREVLTQVEVECLDERQCYTPQGSHWRMLPRTCHSLARASGVS